MAVLKKSKRLKKDLGLLDVYALATGTTLSAGFFLLPGLAAAQAGPAIVAAYLLAAVPMVPAMFSIIELATAMPRAGGMYYFIDRTLGPMLGTIGGMGTWLALVLKVSFALVGMGAYITIFMPTLPITEAAVGLALALGVLNIFGARKGGRLQVYLLIGLLGLLTVFIGWGVPEIEINSFKTFIDTDMKSLFATTGLVYISYVGVTNVASLSEEVKNPEKNLPLGVILALTTAVIVYGLGTAVMVGVVPMEEFIGDMTPVSTAAYQFLGETGAVLLAVAALLAFVSVANAGTMSASRYPLAMSRDHLLPRFFSHLGKFDTPSISIAFTVAVIISILIFIDPTSIAKLASTFQLLMFAFICLAVIVMRESRIDSYDPGYKSPFYPWMQILGIIIPIFIIVEMGYLPMLFTVGLMIIGFALFKYYAKKKVYRSGAVFHIFERLGHQRYHGLDAELRGILKEKGLRKEDPFDEIIMSSAIIDLDESMNFDRVVDDAADKFTELLPLSSDEISKQFLEGTRVGATPVTHGVALPHFRCDGIDSSKMVLVRCKPGIRVELYDPIKHEIEGHQSVTAVFFLVSPENNPSQHLRILAQIAGRVDDASFAEEWDAAKDELELREALLHNDRFMSLRVQKGTKSEVMIEKPLKDIPVPSSCLVAVIKRDGQVIIPKGDTVLFENDRLTVIGDPAGMREFKKLYTGSTL